MVSCEALRATLCVHTGIAKGGSSILGGVNRGFNGMGCLAQGNTPRSRVTFIASGNVRGMLASGLTGARNVSILSAVEIASC